MPLNAIMGPSLLPLFLSASCLLHCEQLCSTNGPHHDVLPHHSYRSNGISRLLIETFKLWAKINLSPFKLFTSSILSCQRADQYKVYLSLLWQYLTFNGLFYSTCINFLLDSSCLLEKLAFYSSYIFLLYCFSVLFCWFLPFSFLNSVRIFVYIFIPFLLVGSIH